MNQSKKLKFFKNIAYILRYRGGDMPYPPLIIWQKKLTLQKIRKAWQKEAVDILTGRQKQDRVGIYLHIPFCVTKCFYCNCISFPQFKKSQHKIYLNCLEKEIRLLDLPKEIKIRTFYIGGGTPSILQPSQLERLFKMIYRNFNLSECEQVMSEVSPYTISSSKIKILKDFGVNKVTIGVQTLDSSLLKKLNRPQEKKMVLDAFYKIRKAGIKYINIDLMAGLPSQTISSFIETLEEILELKPDTIHINPFFPTSFTPFSLSGRQLNESDIKKRTKMIQLARQLIQQNHPYAFERDELEKENIQLFNSSKFNSSVLGLGWGAISHIRGYLHYAKDPDYRNYLENLQKNRFPKTFGYFLNQEEEMRATLINAFEREQTVDKKIFGILFNKDPLLVFEKEFKILMSLNRIRLENDVIKMISRNRIEPFIYSKFFYSPKVINKLKKIIDPKARKYQNIDLKLACFYETD